MRSKAQAIARQEAMLRLLDGGENVSVQRFSALLKCSYATVRNDLAYLEQQGLVVRTHGGAIRAERSPIIALNRREVAKSDEKRAIAQAAFERFIREDETIIIDSGTTMVELARVIAASGVRLTVLTHSAPVIQLLCSAENVKLFAFGGSYHRNSDAFYDGNIHACARTMHADVFFMGFNGLVIGQGFAHAMHFEQEVKQDFIRMSARTVAMGDASKLTQSALWIAGTFDEVGALATDAGIPGELKAALRERGVEVLATPTRGEGEDA